MNGNVRKATNRYLISFFIALCAAGSIGLVNIAHAEIVVIVSKDSSIGQVSVTDIGRLFLGKTGELPGGTKVEPIDLGEGSSTRDDFYQSVANKSQLQLNAYWSRMIFTGKGRPPKVYRQEAEVIARVSSNSRLVGYVDKDMLTDEVKVIAHIAD